ncbi:hypothetical protein RCL1_003576 [Eukaryota sp. TZLM3-RCL]
MDAVHENPEEVIRELRKEIAQLYKHIDELTKTPDEQETFMPRPRRSSFVFQSPETELPALKLKRTDSSVCSDSSDTLECLKVQLEIKTDEIEELKRTIEEQGKKLTVLSAFIHQHLDKNFSS